MTIVFSIDTVSDLKYMAVELCTKLFSTNENKE